MNKYDDWQWVLPKRVAQGGYPGNHPGLFQAFDTVVYTAMEGQPKVQCPPGKIALYAPLDDDIYRPVPRQVGAQLHLLAADCARQVRGGRRVLITCMQGRNRSGLVTALTLLKLYPNWAPEQAIRLIKRNRRPKDGEALANTMFTMYLSTYGHNP